MKRNQAKHADVRPELGSDSSFDHRKRCLCQTWCAVEERGRTGIGERTVSNIVPAQKYKTDFIDVVAWFSSTDGSLILQQAEHAGEHGFARLHLRVLGAWDPVLGLGAD